MLVNIPFIINLIAELPEAEQLSLDVAKQLIQSQHNLATIGISVLVGIAVLLMAVTWLWNFYLHKRELERAIETLKSEITARADERIKDEVGKMENEIKESIAKSLTKFDADKARLFAITAGQEKVWEAQVSWWAKAIEGYAKTEQEHLLRVAVDALNDALKKCETLKADRKEDVKKYLSFIPEILQQEKEQIEKRLNELPKKIKKESAKT